MKKWLLMTVLLLGASGMVQAQIWKSTPQFRQAFLSRINVVRQQGCNCGIVYMPPVAPLVWNDKLENSARGHAHDMEKLNYFSHTSQDGRTMSNRIEHAGYGISGYKSWSMGENIAMGQQSIDEVSAGWFNSPGHCKNLMSANFQEIGIAEYNSYWVQDFGGRTSFTPQEQQMIKSGAMHIVETRRSDK